MARLYVPDLKDKDIHILSLEEERYLLKVLRFKRGDGVTLFDGCGNVAYSTLEVGGGSFYLKIFERFVDDFSFKVDLTLALGAIRTQNFEFALIKCNELLVNRFFPISTRYTKSSKRDIEVSSKINRFKKLVIESSRQCGRNFLMEVSALKDFLNLFKETYDFIFLFEKRGRGNFFEFIVNSKDKLQGKKILTLIGPEGGWSDEEIEYVKEKGGIPISLGPTILKSETAAVSVSSIFYNVFYG